MLSWNGGAFLLGAIFVWGEHAQAGELETYAVVAQVADFGLYSPVPPKVAPLLVANRHIPKYRYRATTLSDHPPHNVLLDQFNNDGSRIFWTNTSNTRTVYFMSHSEMDPQPNQCPVCATMQIELIVAGHPFKYTPTKSIDGGCSALGDNNPTFDISSGFITLAANTYYKWQARVIANYEWFIGSSCAAQYRTFSSEWQVGVGFMAPGYFSFKTP